MTKRYTTSITQAMRRLSAIFLLLPLAGCMSDRPGFSRDRDDPLTGLPSRVPADQRSVSTSPESADRVTSATLTASNSTRSQPGVSGLGIRDGNNPVSDSSQAAGAWTGAESKTPAAGAKLGSPRVSPATGNFAQPASATNRSPLVRVRSFEEAQQFLSAHGVQWQRLNTTGENDWLFSCTIPSKSKPGSMNTYEAHDKYGLLAMQKVIDEIVRDQGTR